MTTEKIGGLLHRATWQIALIVSGITLMVPVAATYATLVWLGLSPASEWWVVVLVFAFLGTAWTFGVWGAVGKRLLPQALVDRERLLLRFAGVGVVLTVMGIVLSKVAATIHVQGLEHVIMSLWTPLSYLLLAWGIWWAAKADDRCHYPLCRKPIGDDPDPPVFTDAADSYRHGKGLIMLCGGCRVMLIGHATYERRWLNAEVAERWPKQMTFPAS